MNRIKQGAKWCGRNAVSIAILLTLVYTLSVATDARDEARRAWYASHYAQSTAEDAQRLARSAESTAEGAQSTADAVKRSLLFR